MDAPGPAPQPSIGALLALVAVAGAAAAVLLTVPLVDGVSLIAYTADDAYISFRYSDHFAAGHGPVFNEVGPRTDGYTSALWMALIALPAVAGIDLAIAAKVLSLLAAAGLVALLAFAGGRRALLVRLVCIAGLLLSPAFLTLTVQGMETTAAALFAALAAWLLVRAVAAPGDRELAAFNVACLLAVLTRPDLAVFAGVCLLGLWAWLVRRGDRATLVRALAWTGGALVLPAGLWALWRWSYYGYPLPNTAYAKRSGELIDPAARRNVQGFLTTFALPYVVALAGLVVHSVVRRQHGGTATSWAIATALAGAGAFLFAGLFFSPLQGNLWRFQMPVFPVLLLCLVLLAARTDALAALGLRGRPAMRAAAWAGAALVAAFPLLTLDETRFEVRGRWTHDRIQAGKALEPFARDGLTMFVTESGALPLYSEWRAYDLLGLNDHDIAVEGATAEHVGRRLDPDVLQFIAAPPRRPGTAYDVFRGLLEADRYEFAAATVKTNDELRPGVPRQAHFYFVKKDAQRADELLAALRDIPDVRPLPTPQARIILDHMAYPG